MKMRTPNEVVMVAILLLGGLAVVLAPGRAEAGPDEVERLRQEVRRLQDQVAECKKQAEQQQLENAELRKRLQEAQIQAATLRQRSEKLLTELETVTKENARLRGTRPAVEAPANVPPAEVEGTVKEVDASGLIVVSVGRDAGLRVGQTLEVYRLSPKPLYLGRIRIVDARPKEAIGKVDGKSKEPIKAGDRVGALLTRPEKP